MIKYFICGGDSEYIPPFEYAGMSRTSQIEDTDLVVFTGGTDVSPSLYGDDPIPETDRSDVNRDKYESEIFNLARELEVPIVGICRGSQFLCAMNGGKVIQHVTGHATGKNHSIMTHEHDTIEVTSTHHQMMYPFCTKNKILAWSSPALSDVYKTGDNWPGPLIYEPEVVYFPISNSLAVQYHPEYMPIKSKGFQYFQSLLVDLLSGSL